MQLPLVAAMLVSLSAAGAAPTTAGAGAATSPGAAQVPRSRVLLVEEVKGEQGTPHARTALREALARHLGRRGFQVLESGKRYGYRLQPKLILFDVQDGTSVEVKASVVALDPKGRVAAMVEGGARAKGGAGAKPATAPGALEAQALEAAARSLVEDLAPRLVEVR